MLPLHDSSDAMPIEKRSKKVIEDDSRGVSTRGSSRSHRSRKASLGGYERAVGYSGKDGDVHPALAAIGRLHHHGHHFHPHDMKLSNIPWKHLMTNRVALTLFANAFIQGFIGFMIVTELPYFLFSQLGVCDNFIIR
jgi:hypothetical protein